MAQYEKTEHIDDNNGSNSGCIKQCETFYKNISISSQFIK